MWTVDGAGTTSPKVARIAMVDRVGQADVGRHHQRGATALAAAHRLTIGASEDGCVASPAITAPGQRTAVRAADSQSHRSLHEIVADASGGAGGDETAGAVLHQASPAFA